MLSSKEALNNLYQGSLNPVNCVYATFRTGRSEKITDDYNTIEHDLKVLELIKKKSVNIDLLIKIVSGFNMSTNEEQRNIYNSNVALVNILYEDEFNLLKEWLNRE